MVAVGHQVLLVLAAAQAVAAAAADQVKLPEPELWAKETTAVPVNQEEITLVAAAVDQVPPE